MTKAASFLLYYFFLLFALSLQQGCFSEGGRECESHTIKVQSPEFLEVVSARANDEGIWHRTEADAIFRYCKSDHSQVLQLVANVSSDFLPVDRSVSYAPRLHELFKSELTSAEIPYREQKHGDNHWVIWDEVHADEVREIQERLRVFVLENPEVLNQ